MFRRKDHNTAAFNGHRGTFCVGGNGAELNAPKSSKKHDEVHKNDSTENTRNDLKMYAMEWIKSGIISKRQSASQNGKVHCKERTNICSSKKRFDFQQASIVNGLAGDECLAVILLLSFERLLSQSGAHSAAKSNKG